MSITFFLYTLLYLSLLLCDCSAKSQASSAKKVTKSGSTAPIPRSKQSKKGGIFGQGFFHRLVREVKISFSSELEGLVLQVVLAIHLLISQNVSNDCTALFSLLHKINRR